MNATKYPNLRELMKYHPYHISTFADHANVTIELLQADDEELKPQEMLGICRLVNVPYTVLTLDHLIYLDRNSYRHREMIENLIKRLYDLSEYQKAGSKAADDYMKGRERRNLVNLELDFINGVPVTYCRYLGVKATLDQTFFSVRCERIQPRKREVSRKEKIITEIWNELQGIPKEDIPQIKQELLESSPAVTRFIKTAFSLIEERL